MGALTDGEVKWLARLADRGWWPAPPFLRDKEASIPLMRKGLAEAIQPPAPYLPYVVITDAGREALPPSAPRSLTGEENNG